jgi:hypothetical protein
MNNEFKTSHEDRGATRRQFLVLGSAAVAGAAATTLSADAVRKVFTAEAPAPVLSVGFADATLTDFENPEFAARLSAALDLSSSDPAFSDAVRVRILGLVQPEAERESPVSFAIDAMYRLPGNLHEVPFLAWSHARRAHPRHTEFASASTPFTVPVGANHPLKLTVSTTNQVTGKSVSCGAVELGLGNGRNGGKLRRGVYFVAICPPGAPLPDWGAMQVKGSEKGEPVLQQPTLAGANGVPFGYVTFVTDYV